jgi:hypothetical protein
LAPAFRGAVRELRGSRRGPKDPRLEAGPYLDVVADEDPAEVEHLQHGGRIVVRDAVAFQDVLRARDLPGEPAQVKGRVAGQQVGQVAGLAAAAASVVLITFRDGLHLPLLAVGSCPSTTGGMLDQESVYSLPSQGVAWPSFYLCLILFLRYWGLNSGSTP